MTWAEATLRRHPSVLVLLTLMLASAHLAVAVLHVIDRAAPVIVPSRMPDWLKVIVLSGDDRFWVWLHSLAAAGLIATVGIGKRRGLAGFFSSTVWTAWSLIILLWSVWTDPPASLTAPIVLLILAVPLGRIVAAAWTEEELHRRTRE